MMRRDRSRPAGVAVIAATVERQRSLRLALDAAGMTHWMVLLQDVERGHMLPPIDGPLLLDTAGFKRAVLAAILAELHDGRPAVPTLALVAPDDLVAQRLSLLCSAVYAVAVNTIACADLRVWFRYVGLVGPQRSAVVQPACLAFTPAPLPSRDPDLLRILAELPHAATTQQAAAACALSERTLKRKLTLVRDALGIPATGVTRYRPAELADLLWMALSRSDARPAAAAAAAAADPDPRGVDPTPPFARARRLP